MTPQQIAEATLDKRFSATPNYQGNYIHPLAVVGPNVKMGQGNYIGPFCVLGGPAQNPSTIKSTKIGEVIIGDNNYFMPHVIVEAGVNESITMIGHDNFFYSFARVVSSDTISNNEQVH